MEIQSDAAGSAMRADPLGNGTEDARRLSVEVLAEGEGLETVEAVVIRHGSRLREIVRMIALKGGYEPTEALLFIEDEPETLNLEIIVDGTYPHHRKHHVHRIKQIDVVVHYAMASHQRHFPPSARVETALTWAIREFEIDPAMAAEFELTLVGSTEELPGSKHIGTLLRHPACRLELNLVRGVMPNGDFA